VNLDNDTWSSKFQKNPILIKEKTPLPTRCVDLHVSRRPSAIQIDSSIEIDIVLPSRKAKKPRWFTQTI